MQTSKIIKKRGASPIGSNKCTSSSSSSCARTVAAIGDHGLQIPSVVSSPEELIVGRFFRFYEDIHTVYFVRCLPLLLVPQIFPLNICFSSPSALIKCQKKLKLSFSDGFEEESFVPGHFHYSLVFLLFSRQYFHYSSGVPHYSCVQPLQNFTIKERGTNQSEIFIGEKE